MSSSSVIVCKPVKETRDLLLDKVEKTYNNSFPEGERRAFSLLRDLLRDETRFCVYALLREDIYVGFITAWIFDDFMYVEHFAIDESARNGGIGANAMKQFLSFCDKPVVLEVEMPVDEMSCRRVGFYERLGYVLDNHTYYQPPYRKGEEWLEMRLMTQGEIDLEQSFEKVKHHIHKNVYGVTD